MLSVTCRAVLVLFAALKVSAIAVPNLGYPSSTLIGYNYRQPIRSFVTPPQLQPQYSTFSTAPQFKSVAPLPLKPFVPLAVHSTHLPLKPIVPLAVHSAPLPRFKSVFTSPAAVPAHIQHTTTTHITQHHPVATAIHRQPIHVQVDNRLDAHDHDSYVLNGRHLHQYAVMEVIQGDLAIPEEFLGPTSLDLSNDIEKISSRASFGGAGGASRARTISQSPVSIGSGSLGYIRLPNGGVYLGSGSLGYISGQQRSHDIQEAKARKDSGPDPLHFGPGPSRDDTYYKKKK